MFSTFFIFINYVCSSRCLTDGEDVGGAPDNSVDVCCGGVDRNGNEGCTKRTRSTSMDELDGAVLAAALNADVNAVAAQRV